MRRDHPQEAVFNARRSHARREWSGSTDEQYHLEAPEHARPLGKMHRTCDIREREAEHEIRELRARG